MGALITSIFGTFRQVIMNIEPNIMDINKIQSALQSLKEERAHIEEYLQNAAARKKELDKELNATFNRY